MELRECTCGHREEAHGPDGRCVDWRVERHDFVTCECTSYVESGIWSRMFAAADIASRSDASTRRELHVWGECRDGGATLMLEDPTVRNYLVSRVARTLQGWGYVATLTLQWMLTAALVAVLAGCSSSRVVDDAGDVDGLTDAGDVDARHVTPACIRAANVADAADFRLHCHIVPGCACELTGEACDVDDAVRDACVAARSSATSCAELTPTVCDFSPLFPETP